MNKDNKPIVLFYPTGIVHMRNLEILRKILPNFRFLVIVESWLIETAMESLNYIDTGDRVMVENGMIPGGVWDQGVDILFLSMAYPNPFRLYLAYEAVSRDIPIMTIEEVNQLALNDGIINHYFLPIDYLGAPSDVEKKKFMDLGIPGEKITVTGWPFFDEKEAFRTKRDYDIRREFSVRKEKKCCLLVLGSLKEQDMVSLETQKVRQEIFEIVSGGLAENFQLFIKPHPIETEASLEHISKSIPNSHVLSPKYPIEPLLEQVDVVVNRGNSQVTLIALLQSKPVIVAPVGLKTIFHGVLDSVIADSAQQFRRILGEYSWGKHDDYRGVLSLHFPISHAQALQKVAQLFELAVKEKVSGSIEKKIYISILYAFLGDAKRANEILNELPGKESVGLLKKLFKRSINVVEFVSLLTYFPGKIVKWHLQALFIRTLSLGKTKAHLILAAPLLKGFNGAVNPHYFMEDIVKRIELEFRAGNDGNAEELLKKFIDDYSVFDYYKQAFDMLRFVYRDHHNFHWIRKILWLLKNFNKPYARRRIKRIVFKK